MQYLGGKTRIAKEILPLILADRKEGQILWWLLRRILEK